jgi:hypothetical protein
VGTVSGEAPECVFLMLQKGTQHVCRGGTRL